MLFDDLKIKKLTKQALDNDELHLLLSGKEPYNIRSKPDLPSDLGIIIEYLYRFHRKDEEKNYNLSLRKAIVRLMDSEDCYDIWIAYRVCWLQHYRERNDKSPFDLINHSYDLKYNLMTSIEENKDELSSISIPGISDDSLYDNIMETENSSRPIYDILPDVETDEIAKCRKELELIETQA